MKIPPTVATPMTGEADHPPIPWLHLRPAVLRALRAVRPGVEEWWIEPPEAARVAVSYPPLSGHLTPGDRVLLNTTARDFGLGTGGVDFVVARLAPAAAPAQSPEAGHL